MTSIDYSSKMPSLSFAYDSNFYPLDSELPDPQVDPIIPGAKVPINKVGIAPVDLPIRVKRRDGTEQVLQAQASLYCSLDNPAAKGLNLSRLYIVMHDTIENHLTLDGIKAALQMMAEQQNSSKAFCKLRFKYPWTQPALRSRAKMSSEDILSSNFTKLDDGEMISNTKAHGHIAYNVTIEGRYDKNDIVPYRFFLTLEYVYSSTCPCSFELARTATEKRQAAANAHSQRSIMTTTVEFDADSRGDDFVWIEDLVELHRAHIPTEVQIYVKRRDEQAFAELNGSNLLFSEDAVRIMYGALDKWYEGGRIFDFSIATCHLESLHPWEAIAIVYKGIPGGLR